MSNTQYYFFLNSTDKTPFSNVALHLFFFAG